MSAPMRGRIETQRWIAVLDRAAAASAQRAQLREIALDERSVKLPSPGDRVAVLVLPEAVFVGVATAGRPRSNGSRSLHLRDRIRAPLGHYVDPFALRPLPSCVMSWTRARLAGLAGTLIPIGTQDADRIGSAILAQALSFGPVSTRPARSRARTPGRRALMEGRSASGTLRARR